MSPHGNAQGYPPGVAPVTDSILIVGSGIAGLTAALECVHAGAKAIVIDNAAIIGGKLAAAMTAESSVEGRIDGAAIPQLNQLRTTENIEFITLASLESIEGRPGNFDVAIRERARFVTDACTRCRRCRPVCPSVSANEFDEGLTYRKAIFTPLPETLPQEYVINIDSCLNKPPNYLPCNLCTEVCDDDAIHFDMPIDQLHKKQVGAVVVATGFNTAADDHLQEYGYGAHPDIVTSAELQHLLMSPGPTAGFVAKPSNEEYPESILLIIDELTPFAAYTAVKQGLQLVDQDVGRLEVLIAEQPGSLEQSNFLQALPAGITVHQGLLQTIEAGTDNRITVSYAEFSGNRIPEESYDMVVLSAEPRPPESLKALVEVCALELNDAGFVATRATDVPCKTSCEGIYVAGGARGPIILPDTVEEARVAAIGALSHLDHRLLKPEYRPLQAAEATATPVDEAFRARIERALYALMDQ